MIVALGVLLAVVATSGAQAQRRLSRRRNGHRTQHFGGPVTIVIVVLAIGGLSCFLIAALVLVAS
ncbi:hypothetical protein [Curtobacterium sp. CFBP9011]|uniref:hypothetical protein n=1 Tax=Curtobacterium sp. CFBP9011 TaxID=3096530 RepID=UPI002A6A833F|nr:hypothetical protein [Curtobacterium sp. CFBP9011]MDY1005583.1 hypothetical protein [Curtobacterium sp. CFBP9011]